MQGGAWCVCISEMRPVGVDWGAGGGGEKWGPGVRQGQIMESRFGGYSESEKKPQ